MKAVVLGAGVVGVTTAYELARDGHEVTVIDRREGPALETSFANGGQLSWDHGEPLPGPGVVRKALAWLGRVDAPLLFRLRLDPALWGWTLRFLANCPEHRFWHNAHQVLRIALYARERLHGILRTEAIAFDHRQGGILGLFQDEREFERAADNLRAWQEIGGTRRALNHKDCVAAEPALAHSTFQIAGGIHAPLDESGDCYEFTRQLAARAEALGATFRWNTTVLGLAKAGWKITAAHTDQGDVAGDAFVMALGSYSPLLLKALDLDLPLYPAKGYSITLPIQNADMAPKLSITSQAHKLVFSRFGARLRVAGMLELNGYDTVIDEKRARIALDATLKLFPQVSDGTGAALWTGLRPMTPDGVPVLGRAKQENLVLNTGHGMLGWTMATGTARIAADLAAGKSPEVDLDGLGWERFG